MAATMLPTDRPWRHGTDRADERCGLLIDDNVLMDLAVLINQKDRNFAVLLRRETKQRDLWCLRYVHHETRVVYYLAVVWDHKKHNVVTTLPLTEVYQHIQRIPAFWRDGLRKQADGFLPVLPEPEPVTKDEPQPEQPSRVVQLVLDAAAEAERKGQEDEHEAGPDRSDWVELHSLYDELKADRTTVRDYVRQHVGESDKEKRKATRGLGLAQWWIAPRAAADLQARYGPENLREKAEDRSSDSACVVRLADLYDRCRPGSDSSIRHWVANHYRGSQIERRDGERRNEVWVTAEVASAVLERYGRNDEATAATSTDGRSDWVRLGDLDAYRESGSVTAVCQYVRRRVSDTDKEKRPPQGRAGIAEWWVTPKVADEIMTKFGAQPTIGVDPGTTQATVETTVKRQPDGELHVLDMKTIPIFPLGEVSRAMRRSELADPDEAVRQAKAAKAAVAAERARVEADERAAEAARLAELRLTMAPIIGPIEQSIADLRDVVDQDVQTSREMDAVFQKANAAQDLALATLKDSVKQLDGATAVELRRTDERLKEQVSAQQRWMDEVGTQLAELRQELREVKDQANTNARSASTAQTTAKTALNVAEQRPLRRRWWLWRTN